jgi:PIN domain nuclease of toxin-antitoxin system
VKLLLDTHAFLWMSLDAPQLSQRGRELIADTDNELLLSPASYWEIAIKIRLGNYELDEPLDEFVNREIERNVLTVVPIAPEHAAVLTRLPFHHRDPFDRMLVAQALLEQVSVLSKDVIFGDYGVGRLW